MSTFLERIAMARAGTNPTVICRAPSGWMVMRDSQFLRGYSLLLADPVVPDLNGLDALKRAEFQRDMTILGDALLEVTNAYRINCGIMGNLDPFLHVHVAPRYMSEPEEFRTNTPWNYPRDEVNSIKFDYELDRELMQQIAAAVQRRL